MKRAGTFWAGIVSILAVVGVLVGMSGQSFASAPGQGTLTIIEPDGKPGKACPLEHTSMTAEISGFVGRVEVKQIFHNPMEKKIEAVYTFPLSADAAVDDMLMKVGDRTVRGLIKPREEARRIYEQARDRGHVASLLDQERPNIFTQSVANIMPGEKVEITIKYVEVLRYDDGMYKFVFPMVVGPRFIPGRPEGKQGTGWSDDTTKVPDASRITPPVTEKGTRAGHDIDVTVSLDAGVPVEKIESKLHEVEIVSKDKNRAVVSMKNKKEIPNRDFVLEYVVAGDQVKSGVLAHKEDDTGYLTVFMVPPKREKPVQIAPRELIFIVDRSGSQTGKPLEKCKETMKYIIERMNPDDTFNFIDFANQARMLFSSPKKNTPETKAKALQYLDLLQAGGGTQMVSAIWESLSTQPEDNRLRVVTLMTDGFIGNDFEVISMIQKLRGTSRWFAFGTGNSVNRFLLDNVARVGAGEVDYILLNTPGEEVAKNFYDRIANPILTDISVSAQGIILEDVYPAAVSDLWTRKPLVFKARYSKSGKGTVKIKGFQGGKPYEQDLKVELPAKESRNGALKSLWARAKVDDLMDRDLMGIQRGNPKKEVKEEIIKVALDHRIVTQFTSFVAVEEAVVTVDGKPTRVAVPVEMPEGVTYEGVFGERQVATGAMPVPGVAQSRRYGVVAGKDAAMKQFQHYSATPAASAPVPTGPRVLHEQTTPEVAMEARIHPKLSPELAELVKMKEVPKDYSRGKVTVIEGKITVQVWVTSLNDDIIKKLEQAGLTITFKAATGKMVIGVVSVEKLEELSKLNEVRLIEPFAAG